MRILADGQFHSGEVLGQELGISRAGVWKHLRALKARGIDICSIPGKGHRLAAAVELLSEPQIRAALSAPAHARLGGIELYPHIDSTNSELRRRAAALPSAFVCLAEEQTAGRGRCRRDWVSPFARNLYLSLLWRFDAGPDALSGLGLAVGVAVLRALRGAGIAGVGLKWPNDLVWNHAKCAGALVEMTGESGGGCSVVIGVGVNVDMPRRFGAAIPQPWTDLRSISGQPVSRNLLAGRLISELCGMLGDFERAGLASVLDEWRGHDILYGHPVVVSGPRGDEAGVARGVDAGGALLVKRDGAIRRYLSGDVSVRSSAVLCPGTGHQA